MDQATVSQVMQFFREHPSTFLATAAGDQPWVRAMWVARIEDDGTLWYATGLTSDKVAQIRQNPRVCVAGGEGMTGARLVGRAEIVTDAATKAALWEDSWSNYFAGKDDPDYTLIRITPEQGEVW